MSYLIADIISDNIKLIWEVKQTYNIKTVIHIYGSSYITDRVDPNYFKEILTISNPSINSNITNYLSKGISTECEFIVSDAYEYRFYRFKIEEYDANGVAETLISDIFYYKYGNIIKTFNFSPPYSTNTKNTDYLMDISYDLNLYGNTATMNINYSTSKDNKTFSSWKKIQYEVESYGARTIDMSSLVDYEGYIKIYLTVEETITDGSDEIINTDGTEEYTFQRPAYIEEEEPDIPIPDTPILDSNFKIIRNGIPVNCEVFVVKDGGFINCDAYIIKNGVPILIN